MDRAAWILLSHAWLLAGLAPGSLAAAAAITHDHVQKVATIADARGDLLLRLSYSNRCVLDGVLVRGRQVVGGDACVYSGIRIDDHSFTTRRGIESPTVSAADTTLTVTGIRFGGGGIQVQEVWRFISQPD